MTDWGTDGWVVRPDEGRRVEVGGPHELHLLLHGWDAAGAMGVFEFRHAPILVNPPHAHLNFMKVIYVLEGEYAVRVGAATFDAVPGSLIVVPAGSQHTFTTTTGGRMLFACAPGGNEQLFLEYERLGSGASAEELAIVGARMGTIALDAH